METTVEQDVFFEEMDPLTVNSFGECFTGITVIGTN